MQKSIGVAVLGVLPLPVFAAVPEAVSAAVTTAGADGATVAGLVIGAIVLLFGFSLMKKALGR